MWPPDPQSLIIALACGSGVALMLSARLWPAKQVDARGERPLHDRLRDELMRAGFERIPVPVFVVSTLALGIVLGAIAFGLTGVIAVGLIGFVTGCAAPIMLTRWRSRQRRNVNRLVWPDVVDHVVSSIRSGLSLPEAVATLATTGPETTRPEFAAFAQSYRVTGSFRVALDELKHRLADPTADRLIETLRMAKDVGGTELTHVLRSLSGFLREEQAIRHEVEARQSWVMNAAKLGAAAPWVVLVLLSFRTEAAAAYNTPEGFLLIVAGAVVTVIAYQAMVRMGRLREDRRWFA